MPPSAPPGGGRRETGPSAPTGRTRARIGVRPLLDGNPLRHGDRELGVLALALGHAELQQGRALAERALAAVLDLVDRELLGVLLAVALDLVAMALPPSGGGLARALGLQSLALLARLR